MRDLPGCQGSDRNIYLGLNVEQGFDDHTAKRHCGGNDPKAQFAMERPGRRFNGKVHGLACRKELLGPWKNRFTLRRKCDKASIPDDQPLAKFLLEICQTRRKRGLRNVA